MKLPAIKRPHAETEYTPENIQELAKCMNDPLYFIENYVKVQHPTKGVVPMELYDYQKEMLDVIHKSKDTVALLSRQMGKCFLVDTSINTIKRPTGIRKLIFRMLGGNFNDILTRRNSDGNKEKST